MRSGIRFVELNPQDQRTLMQLLEERRSMRRQRGVV